MSVSDFLFRINFITKQYLDYRWVGNLGWNYVLVSAYQHCETSTKANLRPACLRRDFYRRSLSSQPQEQKSGDRLLFPHRAANWVAGDRNNYHRATRR